jgi:hypothetical protein
MQLFERWMMGGKTEKWWRICMVQVVILLFSVQSTFGILACPNRMGFAQSEFLPVGSAICSHYSPDTSNPSKPTPGSDTQHDCPFCLSFVCQVTAILTTELVLPTPDQGTFLKPQGAFSVVANISHTPHNRGPPVSLSA